MQFANSIYTIHKVETKEFIDSFVAKGSFEVTGFEEKDFALKKSMNFHKSEKYNVRVGIWMLKRKL